MIRVAAVGDVHAGADSAGMLRSHCERLADDADVFLIAGDLTRGGHREEAEVLAHELRALGLPTIAVLGNHDYHLDEQATIRTVIEDAGIVVLEGEGVVVDVRGTKVGVAGAKGFGGGFVGACGSDYGEPEMKAFVRHTKEIAGRLQDSLASLQCDVRIALLHYSPIEETLRGEPPPIFPFLGSYLLAEAVDSIGTDLVLHGHAHRGTEKGVTPAGAHVRNVALPVIQSTYNVYCLPGLNDHAAQELSCSTE